MSLREFFLHLRLFFMSNKAKDREIKHLKKELAEKMQELEERERLITLKHKITAMEEEYKIEKLT